MSVEITDPAMMEGAPPPAAPRDEPAASSGARPLDAAGVVPGAGGPPSAGSGRSLRLVLPVLLASSAMALHWIVNVPHGDVQVNAKDQGAKGDAKSKPKPKRPPKKGFEPRPAGELDASWARFETVAFDAEPMKSAWARPHQSLLNKAITYARAQAFEGAPEEPRITVDAVECRTIRCRFVLRGPFAHEVELLSDTLSKLEVDGSSAWRSYKTAKVQPPKPDQPASDTYLEVMVAFREDNLEAEDFRVPDDDADAPRDGEAPPADDTPDDG
ncbi:MAG: hypothetical protein IPH07_31525 [Deltaproteobacteria bacterium]|nr:hypothetical protein [Deltaproteobacteria bacterium]MBK8715447.1 hypothetical protein [Deltaproteobacteria bacterium]MBP7287665.1 hypothetical protein [Nannocystaceae bacterium]